MATGFPAYVTVMGELYKFTARGYKHYLTAVAAHGSADPNVYATRVGGRVYNATDITSENARVILSGGMCSWLPTLRG